MNDLFDKFTIGYVPTEADIARAEISLGVRFPPSYKAFCLKWGFGFIGGLYRIYTPRQDADDMNSVNSCAQRLGKFLEIARKNWREDGFEVGVDVWEGVTDKNLPDRAIFFGDSDNGERLFWDVRGTGEYIIYVEAGHSIFFGGRTLDEFVRNTMTNEIKTIFGPGYDPLPSTFEGKN